MIGVTSRSRDVDSYFICQLVWFETRGNRYMFIYWGRWDTTQETTKECMEPVMCFLFRLSVGRPSSNK